MSRAINERGFIPNNNLDDYELLADGTTHHYINCTKSGGPDCWKTIEDLHGEGRDWMDMLFIKHAGKWPSEKDKRFLSRIWMISVGGVGWIPPSVGMPRFLACVTKDELMATTNGLACEALSAGTHHLGACFNSMTQFLLLESLTKGMSIAELSDKVREWTLQQLQNHKTIHGFGHPLSITDERNALMIQLIEENYPDSRFYHIYKVLAQVMRDEKGLYPNGDTGSAVSYLSLGFDRPGLAVYFQIFARSVMTMAHIFDELPNKPFAWQANISGCRSVRPYMQLHIPDPYADDVRLATPPPPQSPCFSPSPSSVTTASASKL
ncbi:hypothetical protein Pelo_3720 [Pelomyxa schiedti]|nr:hypothetical protein Pelo_3720 [Pelomyxa schiedti]